MSLPRLVSLSVLAPMVLGLSACGISEAEFVPQYNQMWCQHRLDCQDVAQLTFDGVTSLEVCEDQSIPALSEWGDGCIYVGTAADECLADLALITCPAEEGRLAEQPISCGKVYVDCSGATSDTEDSGDEPADTGDEPVDTDPPGDTDAS